MARFLAELPVAPFDHKAAYAYGPVRVASREPRRDALDKLIAAHVIPLDLTLVTNNSRDFSAFPGLRVDNRGAEA